MVFRALHESKSNGASKLSLFFPDSSRGFVAKKSQRKARLEIIQLSYTFVSVHLKSGSLQTASHALNY